MKKCFTCKHWGGDKARQKKEIADRGEVCIDIKNGWPLTGACAISHVWLDVNISGDACVYTEVSSGFGCVLHEND